MKVDLTAALDAMQASASVRNDKYMVVQVELSKNLATEDGLVWKLYATSAADGNTAWSNGADTFDGALESLEENLRPAARFVEDK